MINPGALSAAGVVKGNNRIFGKLGFRSYRVIGCCCYTRSYNKSGAYSASWRLSRYNSVSCYYWPGFGYITIGTMTC